MRKKKHFVTYASDNISLLIVRPTVEFVFLFWSYVKVFLYFCYGPMLKYLFSLVQHTGHLLGPSQSVVRSRLALLINRWRPYAMLMLNNSSSTGFNSVWNH